MTVGVAKTAGRRTTLVGMVVENLEALAIAIVMALILKYFLIEAYKIPTGSMQPEIMGDPLTGVFDRVLVNKLVYLVREPKRYEVVVFKNPLWQRQNYIKRLVGFGGEHLCIRNGDLFVTPPKVEGRPRGPEAIARKSDDVWQAVRKDVAPEAEHDAAAYFRAESGQPVLEGGRVRFTGPTSALATLEHLRDHPYDGYAPAIRDAHAGDDRVVLHDVTDVEFAADVAPEPDATELRIEIVESGRTHFVTLPVGQGKGMVSSRSLDGVAPIEWEDQSADASVPALRPDTTTRVSFRNVDDELVLEQNGRVVLRRPYLTRGLDAAYDPRRQAQPLHTDVFVRATGGFRLTELRLWRDIHYLASAPSSMIGDVSLRGEFDVPPGEYMVLGDNTQNSHDCRMWQKATYRLKDGEAVTGNWFNARMPWTPGTDTNPAMESGRFHFRNVYGEERLFTRSELVGDDDAPDVEYVHSFSKELLLGKALAVFWPLPPFSPTVRLKWVR